MIRFPWGRILGGGSAKPHGASPSDEPHPGNARDASRVDFTAPWAGAVRGERDTLVVSGARSLQSRMTGLLAAGLMISVGAGMLAWYYAEALSRPAAARTPPRVSLPEAAGAGMTLPTFGSLAPPPTARSVAAAPGTPSVPTVAVPQSPAGGRDAPAVVRPLDPFLGPPLNRATGGLPQGYGAPAQLSPRQQTIDRRLSGEVFVASGNDRSANVSATATGGGIGEGPVAAVPFGNAREQTPASEGRGDALEALLHPSVLSATRAQLLPTQRLLLPKGTFVDCTLETAIDSTLPGMTTCVTATDTFGADGTVVLLERGTKLIGETRGEVREGEARVFVVWTEARTPTGVVVRLDSPGTDALGRAGLDGQVNRHFWERFGAAALVSTIDGVVQSEVQSSSRGGTVVLDPTASEDVLTDILRSTVNIPPTIRVRNGARIQVLVARDVDFRPVYELEPR